MITDNQKAVTAFLSNASSYGLAGPVEVMETHISRIFLVGDRAFKMKRAAMTGSRPRRGPIMTLPSRH